MAETHASATRKGKALARTLGKGWTFEVWESIGWWYKAISPCGRWKVHGYPDGHYCAFLSEAGEISGVWAETGQTPQEAVANTQAKALAEVTHRAGLLDLTLLTRAEGSALRIYLEEAQRSATSMAANGHDGPWADIARTLSVLRVKLGDSGELR